MPAPHSRLNKPFHAAAYRYTRGWISLSSRVCFVCCHDACCLINKLRITGH